MIKPQYVYRATNFIFKNSSEPKPKYFVVFHCDESSTLLFSLTTSKPKLPANLDTSGSEGCVQFNDERGYGHAFTWKPDRAIGVNGFSFRLRTSIQLEFRSHLNEIQTNEVSKLSTDKIEECCYLLDNEFMALLQCLVKSKYLKGKHKSALQSKIVELSRSSTI